MDDQPFVLVIARSPQLRNSLRVLIAASTLVKSIHLEANARSIDLLQMDVKPSLVILASDPEVEDIQSTLHHIKQTWPRTPVITLVDSDSEFPRVIQSGAEAALVKGTRASHLLKVIENLLSER